MGKRKRSISKIGQRKRDKIMVDRISDLPDEILTYTLSFLTLRDAAVTSVLSSRWRYLWTSVTSLNFDGPLCMRRHRYIKWVNQILQLHQGSNIGAFRVCFDFDKKYSHHVDHWIDFAIEKGVQSLELDMSKNRFNFVNFKRYTFPCSIFAQERRSYLKNLYLRLCILRPPPGSCSFKSLIALTLENVYVIGEVLENFLSNCSHLERLSVEHAHNLVNLKVAGPSLQLKYLVILFCFDVENIEISAANLVSFKYFGLKTNLSLKNVPQLVDVYFGIARHSDAISYGLRHLTGNLSQLQTLMLGVAEPFEANKGFKNLVVFTNLKHLLLFINANDESLLGFTSLLKASPFLHRLELHLHVVGRSPLDEPIKTKRASICLHKYLKEVELSGFRGQTNHIKLAMYFLKNAIALEKMTIEPGQKYFRENKWHITKSGVEVTAREHAKRLYTKLPPGAELVIR